MDRIYRVVSFFIAKIFSLMYRMTKKALSISRMSVILKWKELVRGMLLHYIFTLRLATANHIHHPDKIVYSNACKGTVVSTELI